VTARSKARKRALDLLYEAEIRGEDVLRLLGERAAGANPPVPEYAAVLVRGVQEHRAKIDGLLAEHSRGWSLDRMPAVDRNILRIGTYELLWAGDVPPGVAISEAVLLARDLSTDSSPAFVNGLLARLAERARRPGPGQRRREQLGGDRRRNRAGGADRGLSDRGYRLVADEAVRRTTGCHILHVDMDAFTPAWSFGPAGRRRSSWAGRHSVVLSATTSPPAGSPRPCR
jgi:N utilization substance protein B